MTDNEANIMKHFRSYRVIADEMLFFNTVSQKAHSREFHAAMVSLMRDGLVNKEGPVNAYSLTERGYQVSRSVVNAQPKAVSAQAKSAARSS